MKISDKSASRRFRVPFPRAWACILLIGVVYAVTFGSAHDPLGGAHHHRNISPKLDKGKVFRAEEFNFSSVYPLHSDPHNHECLTCLLHQQLSNSIVPAPPSIGSFSTQAASNSAPMVFYYSNPIASRPIARLSGRAPPFNKV
jgi:hypothetical protein